MLSPGRPSRGLRPRALLMALLSPILSGLSRLHSTARRLAPGRTGVSAARGAAGGRSWGAGAEMPFVFPIRPWCMWHICPRPRRCANAWRPGRYSRPDT